MRSTCSSEGRPLSTRELDVLVRAAAGDTSKEIGCRLGISETTVKFHFANIYRKLAANSRTEAVTIAIASWWIRVASSSRSRADSPS